MVYPSLFNWVMENTYPRTMEKGFPVPDFHSIEELLAHQERCYGDEVTKHVITDEDAETSLLILLPKEEGLGEVEIFYIDVYDGREDRIYGREPREDSAFEPLFVSTLRQVYANETEWLE